ncbi:YhgE/Pip domain-containing protein, partial [Actinomyces sp.]|uniref:YhgE/Pip domain-containing protein n=1 Tax=Actinomyces sp. TaxID=29317 RepID=UPI002898ACCB
MFTRDTRRLLSVWQAWIILVGVIVTPALYAWVNIAAFWDPYGNTSHIDVAVVDLDRGASSGLTGHIDVGSQVVEQLEDNDQLGWRFTDLDDAMQRVNSGDSYAAIVIPVDFSRNLLSITTGSFTQPQLQYYVNEKANAIAPKITDVGASTIEERITSTFTSMVAEAAAQALREAGVDAGRQLTGARDGTLGALDDAIGSVAGARDSVTSLATTLTDSRSGVAAAGSALDDADRALSATQEALTRSQSLASAAQGSIADFTDTATSSYVQGATLLAQVSSQTQSSLKGLADGVTEVNGHVGTALDALDTAVTANGNAIAELTALLDDAGLDPAVADQVREVLAGLEERNSADQDVVKSLKSVSQDLDATVTSLTGAADAVDTSIQDAATASGQLRTVLTETIPALNQGMSAMSASAGGVSGALTAQREQLTQAKGLLDALDGQIGSTVTALGGLSDNLGDVDEGLDTIRTDVVALGSASVWSNLGTLTDLDPQQIAQFMASPVQVSEQVVFPVAAYGSAMAALFTNLSLWIGSFMLMVILRLEVDPEGVEGLTVPQGYLGRWLLLACVAALQGLLVTAGDLVLGVQHVNAIAFMGTGMLIALAYLSIIYALSVCFSHIGKGLCVVLVIVQIPGASGLYPIEMMPAFFQRLYPFFPFTYGIDAMREVISGFYDGHYWSCLRALAVFVALAFVLGLGLRRPLGNLRRMFNREIASTDLLVAEEVHGPGRYRLSQVLRSLADREDYREFLEHRAHVFRKWHPHLLRGALVAGIVVPVVLAVVPSSDPDTKALLLGLWVAWFLVLFTFLVGTEYIRDSIDDGLALSAMPESDLRVAMTARYRARHAAVRGAVVRRPLARRAVGGTPAPPSSEEEVVPPAAGQQGAPHRAGQGGDGPGGDGPGEAGPGAAGSRGTAPDAPTADNARPGSGEVDATGDGGPGPDAPG